MAVRATDFQIPKITHEEVNENRGVFVIEPLDRGFGYTFGNSLRRVLLSSLEGAAVTSVKIEGVAHEFTTLPGVREDVTDIILNLKQLVCILHGESPANWRKWVVPNASLSEIVWDPVTQSGTLLRHGDAAHLETLAPFETDVP